MYYAALPIGLVLLCCLVFIFLCCVVHLLVNKDLYYLRQEGDVFVRLFVLLFVRDQEFTRLSHVIPTLSVPLASESLHSYQPPAAG